MKHPALRTLLKYFLLSAVCGLAGFSFSYHIPQLKTWLLNEIASFTRDHGPVYVFANELNFHLVPVGISLDDIRVVPKMPLRKDLDAIHVGHISASVDPAMLFASQLGISEVLVEDIHFSYKLHASAAKKDNGEINLPLHEIFNTPVHRIRVTGVHGQITHVDEHWTTATDDLDLLIENRRSGMIATLQPTHFKVARERSDETTSLAFRAQISEDEFNLISFRFEKDDSSINITGAAQGDIAAVKIKGSQWDADLQVEANPLQHSILALLNTVKLPEFDGRLEARIKAETEEGQAPAISGQVRTKDFKVDGHFLGDLSTEVVFRNQKLTTKDIHVQSPASDIHIRDVKASLGENPTIEGTAKVAKLDLREFLNQVKVKDIPIHLDITADVPCKGTLKPILIKCSGVMDGSDFRVFNKETQKNIIALDKIKIKGEVEINPQGVLPSGALSVGEQTVGQAQGSVKFAEGFKFQYHTDNLFFSDIKTLADLHFEGAATIDGTTEGDHEHGLIDLKIATKDLWFENYGVGNAQGELHYKAGKLALQNLDGLFRTSRYRGNLEIDLDKHQIEAQAQIPYIELSDLQKMFGRRVSLPFRTFGSGVADIKVKGPLDFPHLGYTLHSNFTNVSIDDEKLTEAIFNVNSKEGHVKSEHVEVKKKHGSATLTGTAEPSGHAEIQIAGRGFQLEDSQILNKLSLSLQGLLNFDMTMIGQILTPDTHMSGTIQKTFIGQQAVGDSVFENEFHKDFIQSHAEIMGKQVGLDLTVPFSAAAPFRLRLDAAELSLAPFVSLLSSDGPGRDFSASISTHIDLEAATGGFWNSTGTANVDLLKIQKGKLQVQSVAPLHAQFQQGIITFPPWKFTGDNTLFQVEARQARRDHLNFALTGKIEMAVFSFLTPFFSDFRGTLSLAMQTLGRADDINLVGTALIDNGYVRLKSFPHPFENIQTDAIFNKNQLIVNSISMNLAGGRTYGEGAIRFEGLRDIPVQLHGRIENAQFDIPKGVHTQGSGDFQISGNWFPFLLTANFDVKDGLFSRNFDDKESAGATLPRANLLPRFVTEQDVDALRFNIQTNLSRGMTVRNTLLDAEVTGAVSIKGTTNKPLMGGEITLVRGGKLFFHETPFEISAGNVKFSDGHENNPSLYMSANAHVQNYDVALLAQGLSSAPQISLQSSPPLSSREIISLLALGATPEDIEHTQDYNHGQSDNLNYQAGSAILSNNPFGKELKKRTGFEVKFSSAIDDTDKAAVPLIVVKKEFSPKLNMSASHSLGALVDENVKLEYKLSDKLSAVGSWEDKTYTELNGNPSQNANYFGLDLQYRVQFK